MRSFRVALFASATFTIACATPAMAACDLQSNALDCGSTATTNAGHSAGPPSSGDERAWSTSAGGIFAVSVGSGSVISGAGLSVFDSATGPNAVLSMSNNGTVSATTDPVMMGASALNLFSGNSAQISYSGAGNITNFASGGALHLESQGTGGITATIGGNVTAMDGNAVEALVLGWSSNSDLFVSTATGKAVTAGSGATGVFAQNLGSGQTIVVNSASIGTTTGIALRRGIYASSLGGALTVNNSGVIGLIGKPASSDGIYAIQANDTGTGAVNVQSSGAIYSSGGSGITALNFGTGDTTVAVAGAINMVNVGSPGPVGMTGVFVESAGKISLNNTATIAVDSTDSDGVGVYAWSTGGRDLAATFNNSITANGSGAGAVVVRNDAGGTQTVDVNAALTGTSFALYSISDTARTINVGSGGVLNGTAVALEVSRGGALTVNNSGTIGGLADGTIVNAYQNADVTLTNKLGGAMSGTIWTSGGTDLVVNAGTWTTKGTNNFGNGNDTLNNTGTINLAGNTVLSNLETFNQQGTLRLNAYTLYGAGVFTNGANGLLDTSGSAGLSGFSGFVNDGIVDLATGTFTSAGTFTNHNLVLADEGATTLGGQSSFTNAGKLILADNAVGDVLTINSSYAGNAGARLVIDASDSAADKLVVTGAITGSTALDVNLLGTGTLIDGGILVVDGQSTASADAFLIGNVDGGNALARYTVRQEGADFYLDALLLDTAFAPVLGGMAATDLWYQSGDAVLAQTRLPSDGTGRKGIWGQAYAAHSKRGGEESFSVAGNDYRIDERRKTNSQGVQIGFGLPVNEGTMLGLTGGYEHAKLENVDIGGKLTGWNVGAYALLGQATGLRSTLLAKIDRFSLDLSADAFARQKGGNIGLDGEVGYGAEVRSVSLDVSAGLSHVWTRLDDVRAADLSYDYGRFASTRGRFGLRAIGSSPVAPYISAQLNHEFADKAGRLTLTDTIAGSAYAIDPTIRGTWARFEAGIGGSATGVAPTVSGWVDVGDVKGFGARAGLRF